VTEVVDGVEVGVEDVVDITRPLKVAVIVGHLLLVVPVIVNHLHFPAVLVPVVVTTVHRHLHVVESPDLHSEEGHHQAATPIHTIGNQ